MKNQSNNSPKPPKSTVAPAVATEPAAATPEAAATTPADPAPAAATEPAAATPEAAATTPADPAPKSESAELPAQPDGTPQLPPASQEEKIADGVAATPAPESVIPDPVAASPYPNGFQVLDFDLNKDQRNAIGLKVRATADFKWKSMIIRRGHEQRMDADLASELKDRGVIEILGTN